MDGDTPDEEANTDSLAGMTWPTARTLYRFFVVWAEDDTVCCPDVESMQTAISTTQALMECLRCGRTRRAGVEISELII